MDPGEAGQEVMYYQHTLAIRDAHQQTVAAKHTFSLIECIPYCSLLFLIVPLGILRNNVEEQSGIRTALISLFLIILRLFPIFS